MVAVIIGLVLIVTFAVGVMAMVALPRLRGGEDLLTPEGRETLNRAGQRTRESSASAAENTVSAVSTLRDRVSTAWAPASDFLHTQMDRLEGQPGSGATAGSDRDVEKSSAATAHETGAAKSTAPAAGPATVGRPRAVPAISGPIPEIDGDVPAGASSGGSEAAVISLREPGLDETRPNPRIR